MFLPFDLPARKDYELVKITKNKLCEVNSYFVQVTCFSREKESSRASFSATCHVSYYVRLRRIVVRAAESRLPATPAHALRLRDATPQNRGARQSSGRIRTMPPDAACPRTHNLHPIPRFETGSLNVAEFSMCQKVRENCSCE